jgi:hypothetical protein
MSTAEYARYVSEHWSEWQRLRRALEEQYEPRLQRLGSLTHRELRELGDEIHRHITDDLAAGCTLYCAAEIAAVALMKIQIIDEERKRRIVSGAFGTRGEQRALRAFANKSRKRRVPLVEPSATKKARPTRGQPKLF